jgi:tRNA uridine 5-carboxymethylaminomethyl modification enzyme
MSFIRTIEGLEKALVLRPGYGIEHGLIDTRELQPTLESKKVGGLYFAGQVNGTTGYEEAAAQGLIAGINAALQMKNERPFVLSREEAFIGVLINDLTTKGTDEPYRMFTSRSEFRISLRESNADIRLVPLAYKMGLLSKDVYEQNLEKKEEINKEIKRLKNTKTIFSGEKLTLFQVLKRPLISFEEIEKHLGKKVEDISIKREVEIEIKYEGFLRRELIWLKELKNLDKIKIPRIDFSKVPSLSKEVIEKMQKFKPSTLAEALKISGITPAAILNIFNFIKKSKDGITKKHIINITKEVEE